LFQQVFVSCSIHKIEFMHMHTCMSFLHKLYICTYV
jgi:hypothetical protein